MIKIKVLDLPPEALELEKKVEDALVNWVTTAVKSMGLPKGTKNLEVVIMERIKQKAKEKIHNEKLQVAIFEKTKEVFNEFLGGRPHISKYATREEIGKLNGRITTLRGRIEELEELTAAWREAVPWMPMKKRPNPEQEYTLEGKQNKMKISLKELKKIISEEATLAMLEAHGLDPEDAKKIEKHLDDIKDTKDIERILKFIVKSNVKVDKTQDVTKMKKKKEKVEESNGAEVLDPAKLQSQLDSLKARLAIMEKAALVLAKNNKINYIIPLVKKSFDNEPAEWFNHRIRELADAVGMPPSQLKFMVNDPNGEEMPLVQQISAIGFNVGEIYKSLEQKDPDILSFITGGTSGRRALNKVMSTSSANNKNIYGMPKGSGR